MSNIVQFPPDRATVDTTELQVSIALGQAHAIVQLLMAAHGAHRIQVTTCDDTLDSGALVQALCAVDQELRKAREGYDRFLAAIARDAGQEVQP